MDEHDRNEGSQRYFKQIKSQIWLHPNLRFLCVAGDLNTKVRKILYGGNLTLRLLTWDH
jgi:hypothetical protein